jgi:CRP/FNR family transcriptional regulator, cyclic AMP receptor protein
VKEVVMGMSVGVDLRSAGVKSMQAARPRPWPRDARFKTRVEEKEVFDAQAFLASAGVGKKVVEYGKKEIIFTQGDPATSVLYIQKGGVKIAVVNEAGKEAVLEILGPGAFCGEGCLAGQPERASTATTITPSRILVIEKSEISRLLRAERALFDQFMKHVLSRSLRIEEEIVDQLCNSAEKRLAGVLLRLAHLDKNGPSVAEIPILSQQVLAEMVGTTRPRVNVFINRFKKQGFISYDGGLEVHQSLRKVLQGS